MSPPAMSRLEGSRDDSHTRGPGARHDSNDEAITTALLDRLLHKSHVLSIRRRSYWLRDLEKAFK